MQGDEATGGEGEGGVIGRRKPWVTPTLTQIDVAGRTYGPNNANTNDPDYINNPS